MEYKDDNSRQYHKLDDLDEQEEQDDLDEIEISAETEEDLLSEDDPRKKTKRASYIIREIITYMLCFIIALALSRFINMYVGQRTTVDGHSMESTLFDKDVLIVDKLTYRFNDPDRFDIVVFKPYDDEDTYYVKRVIGLPGETVYINSGEIYINGDLLSEDYGKEIMKSAGRAKNIIELSEDEYFVLGDNRNESLDSRSKEVGSVKRDTILGKAWIRMYPIKGIRILRH